MERQALVFAIGLCLSVILISGLWHRILKKKLLSLKIKIKCVKFWTRKKISKCIMKVHQQFLLSRHLTHFDKNV